MPQSDIHLCQQVLGGYYVIFTPCLSHRYMMFWLSDAELGVHRLLGKFGAFFVICDTDDPAALTVRQYLAYNDANRYQYLVFL